MFLRFRRTCLVLLLSALLFVSACATQAPSQFEAAQQESSQRGASAVVRESVGGGNFNQFFPTPNEGYERVYTQEKKGFAEAKLKKEGQEMAMMAISDTLNNPSAAAKFKTSSQTIAGYPAVNQGSTATAILVADRFQVKVLSRDPSFTERDRQAWLEKFDLNGLAKLNQ